MNILSLNGKNKTGPRTVRILPGDGDICRMVRAVLSPHFTDAGAPASGGAVSLTVICSADIPVPPRGAVIVLGGRDEDAGRVIYMSRPCDLEALCENALRLTEPRSACSDGFLINKVSRAVSFSGTEIILTEKEFALFSLLNDRAGELVLKSEIRAALWQDSTPGACDVYACYLRRKLDALCGRGSLVSVRGKGYILLPPGGQLKGQQN